MTIFAVEIGLIQSVANRSLFYLRRSPKPSLIGAYVGDVIFVGDDGLRAVTAQRSACFLRKSASGILFLF